MSRGALYIAAALCAFAALLGNINAAALRKNKLNEYGQLVLQKAVGGNDYGDDGGAPGPGDPTARAGALSTEGGSGFQEGRTPATWDPEDFGDDGGAPDPGYQSGPGASIEGGGSGFSGGQAENNNHLQSLLVATHCKSSIALYAHRA